MTPIAKSLWYIEKHAGQLVTLEDITAVSGVSRTHLSRLFPMVTGYPVLGYVRARRLSEAARRLAEGAPDILTVALDAGYSSHEAFTRAFRDQFGLTPEAVRARRHTDHLQLVEPILMNEMLTAKLAEPRFTASEPMLIAGLAQRFRCDDPFGIPPLWQAFGAYLGHIDGQVGNTGYGVVFDMPDNGETFQYIAGVEISALGELPREFTAMRFPAQRYAVFSSQEHISKIRPLIGAASGWLSQAGYELTTMPTFFEVYPPGFNPVTGNGGFEAWFPVKH
jgi:AraC family transcriptional regulator